MQKWGFQKRPRITIRRPPVFDHRRVRCFGDARHMRNVPGRKTDVKDAEWIAELVCCGLVRSSFVPSKPLRELRKLLRYRRKLVEAQAAERNRLQKLLETANIKLGSVATDVFGVSGRAILRALIDDTASPEEMAELATGACAANGSNWPTR